jgi:hypothetical protein
MPQILLKPQCIYFHVCMLPLRMRRPRPIESCILALISPGSVHIQPVNPFSITVTATGLAKICSKRVVAVTVDLWHCLQQNDLVRGTYRINAFRKVLNLHEILMFSLSQVRHALKAIHGASSHSRSFNIVTLEQIYGCPANPRPYILDTDLSRWRLRCIYRRLTVALRATPCERRIRLPPLHILTSSNPRTCSHRFCRRDDFSA